MLVNLEVICVKVIEGLDRTRNGLDKYGKQKRGQDTTLWDASRRVTPRGERLFNSNTLPTPMKITMEPVNCIRGKVNGPQQTQENVEIDSVESVALGVFKL
ncbi:hypothetical protein O0L34_g19213 [Tuta absoluta]|nr:hypothetical protein O0L34_g19213 [Tuta absoluta]